MTIVSLFDEQPQEHGPEPAGFWIRALARMIDWVMTWFIGGMGGIVVAFVAGIIITVTHRSHEAFMDALQHPSWFRYVTGVLVTLTYHSLCEGVAGATLGKRILGLQVVSEDFGAPTLTQAVKRSLGFFVDGLFFGAVAAQHMNESRMKQRVGDSWANTYVVKRDTLAPAQQRPLSIVLAAVVAAMAAGGSIIIIATGTEIALRVL